MTTAQTTTPLLTQPEFRSRFPVLSDTVHLASCSLGPRSTPMDDAVGRMLEWLSDDPTPWDRWLGEVEQARLRFARLINAAPEQVACVPGATVAAFQVASTFAWTRRPLIVTTDAEYSSLAQVWAAQQPAGAEVVHLREHVEPEFRGIPGAEFDILDERVGLVSVPLVSYRTGALLPVAAAGARAHAVGARVFVDAYQGAGVVPIDVATLGCDYLVSGSMKYLLGVPGAAFLYVRDGIEDEQPPRLTGFYGRSDPIAFDPLALDWPEDARRFQVNLPSLPTALITNAGLGLLEQVDPAMVQLHVDGLVGLAADRLTELGVRLASPTEPGLRGPQVAISDPDPMGLARFLNDRRVFPARGHLLRLSFHYFNDSHDVDLACEAIAEWRRRG